jgi:hypothetical protein
MFALLPIVGGVLLGWLAPRKVAIAGQTLFAAVAVVVLTLTAPEHGGTYRDAFVIAPAVVAASAVTLFVGFWIAKRRRSAV